MIRLLIGDCRDRLRELPDGSVQCVVTSPPYLGLRDYGTAQWDGGDPDCEHVKRTAVLNDSTSTLGIPANGGPRRIGENNATVVGKQVYRDHCRKCGAVRVDQQIGLEPTLAEYIATLVAVFREVRRVLRDDGTAWLNLGDSYASRGGIHETGSYDGVLGRQMNGVDRSSRNTNGLKPKDLMMVPARVAIALQDDGWYLRSDIIWAKRNPMPESVSDRPTSSHEHIFLLTKQSRYFYDAEAVREPHDDPSRGNGKIETSNPHTHRWEDTSDKPQIAWVPAVRQYNPAGRNQRNVWHLATEPFPEAHFATFPTEIPRRCIKAGTSEKGQCPACGAPWVRVVESQRGFTHGVCNGCGEPRNKHVQSAKSAIRQQDAIVKSGIPTTMLEDGAVPCGANTTTGWRPSCTCDAGEPVPQTVLDPFAGAGTTLLVADQLGRHGVGIELNAKYVQMMEQRIRGDAPMFVDLTVS